MDSFCSTITAIIYSLTAQFLLEQVSIMTSLVHYTTGYTFLIMNDNLGTNQNCFDLVHKKYGLLPTEFSVNNPIQNSSFQELFSFMTQKHLLQNIQNNWVTKKNTNSKLSDEESSRDIMANWAYLTNQYKHFCDSATSTTNYQKIYPGRFEKFS